MKFNLGIQKLILGVAFLVTSAEVAACKLGCTEIGCVGGTTVQVPGFIDAFEGSLPVTVKVCVDDVCSSVEVGADLSCQGDANDCFLESGEVLNVLAGGTLDPEAAHTATILITDADDATLFEDSKAVEVNATTPNGPGCGECVVGKVEFALQSK